MKAALKYDVVELILVAVDSSAANDNAHPATRHNVPPVTSLPLPHARRAERGSPCKGGARFPQRRVDRRFVKSKWREDKRGGGLPNGSDVWIEAEYSTWGEVTSFILDGVEQVDTNGDVDVGAWPLPFGFAG